MEKMARINFALTVILQKLRRTIGTTNLNEILPVWGSGGESD